MKTALRVVGRFLLSAVFVRDGLDALLSPDTHVERFKRIEPTLEKSGLPPLLNSDAKLGSRALGAVTLLAGLGLAFGRLPRLCALVLSLVNLPITVINNPLWAAEGQRERESFTHGLLAGASLAGGLALALGADKVPSSR